ncbi:PIN domain-containing protein [Achromobacter sp. UBA2119]|uniref:PIN domain-containing protein n=1 Tax=Achromobacter sp. UBA2119 TaxID=1945911 RepID=UPI00257F1FDB|nr:PIN domain-containing protein [Achromobacter sp. UBA2119]
MSFAPGTADAIAALGLPVLCADTCSILDIVRDPIRRDLQPEHIEVAKHLVNEMKATRLVALFAQQVTRELADNVDNVIAVSKASLDKLKGELLRIQRLAQVHRPSENLTLDFIDQHVTDARTLYNEWTGAARVVEHSADAAMRAYERVSQCLAPAQRGKDSSKDCLVIETYFEAVTELREAGLEAPIVFLTRNSADYEVDRKLEKGLAVRFEELRMGYAPNTSRAKHLLAL